MEPTPKYLAADLILHGGLAAFLRDKRGIEPETRSWDAVARDLFIATDQRIVISGVTAKAWYDRLVASDEKATA